VIAASPPEIEGKPAGVPENGTVVLPLHPSMIGNPGARKIPSLAALAGKGNGMIPVNGIAGRKRRQLILPAPGYSTTAPVS
jgi:hypothetical protein